jgi:TrmH family RNA methyltransferase
MLVKSQVKYIQSLGHKKFRDADGVFVAEGPKIVQELLQAKNISLVQCFATESWLLMQAVLRSGREGLFFQLNEKELERISFHSSPNQVLAVFKKPVFTEEQKPGELTLLLDTIQDPGNLGTIIRTADWFGITRIICSMDTADIYNPKVVQSAMGSLVRVELIYTDLEEYIRANPATPVYAGSLDGEDFRAKIQSTGAMLLMGNESKGIRPELTSLISKQIRIPRKGGAESLNVAVATGILLSWFETVN